MPQSSSCTLTVKACATKSREALCFPQHLVEDLLRRASDEPIGVTYTLCIARVLCSAMYVQCLHYIVAGSTSRLMLQVAVEHVT